MWYTRHFRHLFLFLVFVKYHFHSFRLDPSVYVYVLNIYRKSLDSIVLKCQLCLYVIFVLWHFFFLCNRREVALCDSGDVTLTTNSLFSCFTSVIIFIKVAVINVLGSFLCLRCCWFCCFDSDGHVTMPHSLRHYFFLLTLRQKEISYYVISCSCVPRETFASSLFRKMQQKEQIADIKCLF